MDRFVAVCLIFCILLLAFTVYAFVNNRNSNLPITGTNNNIQDIPPDTENTGT